MSEICVLDWHIAPFRADRWLDIWEPAAARMPAYGAKSWSLTRAVDDPLSFRQSSLWKSRSDFERYWTTCPCCPAGTPCSPPISAARPTPRLTAFRLQHLPAELGRLSLLAAGNRDHGEAV
jgi:hypothetical protein